MSELHEKVWGHEEWIVNADAYCGKRLILNKGWRCSMHHHKKKDETFYVAHGKVFFEMGSDPSTVKCVILGPGGTLRIHPNTWHRFTGVTDAVIFEFSTHHEDDDSYRSEKSGPVTDTQAVYCDRMALVEDRK